MSWFRNKARWAAEKPLFWGNLVIIAATIAFVFVWPSPAAGDFRVKTLGMVMQLVGILTVWLDLTATAREFKKGGILAGTWEWLKAGFRPRAVRLAVHSSSIGVFGSNMRMKVRHPLAPTASLEERVDALERYVSQVDADLEGAYREIGSRADDLQKRLKEERDGRERAVSDVRQTLERAAAGNYGTLLFGAVWLFVGVVLSTWAPEIAKLVAGQLVWASL